MRDIVGKETTAKEPLNYALTAEGSATERNPESTFFILRYGFSL